MSLDHLAMKTMFFSIGRLNRLQGYAETPWLGLLLSKVTGFQRFSYRSSELGNLLYRLLLDADGLDLSVLVLTLLMLLRLLKCALT